MNMGKETYTSNEAAVIGRGTVEQSGSTASVSNSVIINADHRLLSSAELARYVGMSRKFVFKHTENGRMPGLVRCGRHLKYDRRVIDMRLAGGTLLYDGQRPGNSESCTKDT